jgi:hypothetical protein
MIALQDPAIFADSGYLLVRKAVTDARGNIRPEGAGTDWTATFDGSGYFVVRYPDPVVGHQEDVLIGNILAADGKSTAYGLGRIKDR